MASRNVTSKFYTYQDKLSDRQASNLNMKKEEDKEEVEIKMRMEKESTFSETMQNQVFDFLSSSTQGFFCLSLPLRQQVQVPRPNQNT